MKTIYKFCFMFIFLSTLTGFLEARKEVAWLMAGYKDCTVYRIENNFLKTLPGSQNMKLYPGDQISKPGAIDTVRIGFLPYARQEKRGRNTLEIIFAPPKRKDSVIKSIARFLGLSKVNFYEDSAASKGVLERYCLPWENATLLGWQKVYFSGTQKDTCIVFREMGGKVIFRSTVPVEGIYLSPKQIGLQPGKKYSWELFDGKDIIFLSMIKRLPSEIESFIKKDFKKIDADKISIDKKLVKKAAYLQLLSDTYPDEINLFWLSYQILKGIDSNDKQVTRMAESFIQRCQAHFEQGFAEMDYQLLKSPGCMVTIELEKAQGNEFVSPNAHFFEDEGFKIHFQTNFDGYALICYLDEQTIELVFPGEKLDYRIRSKRPIHSKVYEFFGGPCKEKYIFILSKHEIQEITDYKKISPGSKNDMKSRSRRKYLIHSLIKRVEQDGEHMRTFSLGTKTFAHSIKQTLPDLAWFTISLENLGVKKEE